jgi:hypothetical protein
MLQRTGNPGRGWVSRFCFEPGAFLAKEIEPLLAARRERLEVFRETVVKRVEVDAASRAIVSLTAIQRTPRVRKVNAGYDRLPSQDLTDWYDARSSQRFGKRLIRFTAKPRLDPTHRGQEDRATVFIDATEWGELLVLSGASYLQGVEAVDGDLHGNDRCGQSTVFGFVQELHDQPQTEPTSQFQVEGLGFGDYGDRKNAWELIWTYRRLRGSASGVQTGDLSLQNWGYSRKLREGGNDYPFGYLFTSKADATAQRNDWRGGVDLQVMAAAETRALAWHSWFKTNAPDKIGSQRITLARGVLGTEHGLSKLPYIRDTRRSIGLGDFVLKFADLSGPASQKTGTKFPDRVALGAYPADIHHLAMCQYPAFVDAAHDTVPFYISFRALTNRDYGNLLVAGKTMAQTFLANSATRLHPIEWSTGTAAGVAAAEMARSGATSADLLRRIGQLQARISARTPIDWTIEE